MKRTPFKPRKTPLRASQGLRRRVKPRGERDPNRRYTRKGTVKPLGHKDLQPHFRAYIYARDGYTCVSCGKAMTDANRQPGHLWLSSKCGFALRYHPWNVAAQCAYCNGPLNGNQVAFSREAERKFGKETSDAVETLYREQLKVGGPQFKIDWKAAIEFYKNPPETFGLILPFVRQL